MSHTPEQPYEVPYREVDHEQFSERLDEEGRDMILFLGRNESVEWWGTATDWKNERAEIRRREKARECLGGFGFRPPAG